MTYQSKTLPDFIREKVQLSVMSPHISGEDLKKWIGYIEITAANILKEFKSDVLTFDTEHKLGLYIQSNQYAYIEILNLITHLREQGQSMAMGEFEGIKDFHQRVTKVLLELLHYLEYVFPGHFNYNLEVPAAALFPIKQEIDRKVASIKSRLLNVETAALLKITMLPFEQLLTEDNPRLTYHQIAYLRELTDILAEITPQGDVNCKIRTMLANMNFNSDEFGRYMCANMNEHLEACSTTAEKLDKLAWFAKNLEQLHIKPGRALYEKEPDIVQYLLKYINSEQSYLQMEMTLLPKGSAVGPTTQQGESQATSTPDNTQHLKVETKLSVSVQSALIKVMVKADVYKDAVIRDLLRLFSANVRTARKENIDYESMRTQYYSVDASTKTAVIAVCKKMLEAARDLD